MKKVLILLVALVLTACSAMPMSGPVNATRVAETGGDSVNFYANGPVEGASPEEIVEGFIAASAAGFQDDFTVARQFLSSQASSNWIPLQQVRVYSDTRVPTFSRTETGAVRLEVGSEATVDRDGRFADAGPDAVITSEFSLGKNSDGQWRIISLDNGLLLSSTLFNSQYVQAPLYFLTSDQSYLVPDVRWLPQAALSTNIIRQLLSGPASWLGDAVYSAFPEGTTIGTEGVTLDNGVLRVSLSEEALTATQSERQQMKAQILASTGVLSNVHDVEILSSGAPVEIGSQMELTTYPYPSLPLVALEGDRPVEFSGGEVTPLRMSTVPPALSHVARGYSEDAPIVALSNETTLTTLPTDGSAPVSLMFQDSLIPPSVDRYGWVWSGSTQANGYFNVATLEGQNIRVSARWLQSGTISSIHVSREGSRIVIVYTDEGATRVVAAAVSRNSDGRPTRLAEPLEIASSFESVLDLSWMSATQVIVLGQRIGSANVGLYPLVIGGPMTSLNEVAGAVSVTAGSNEGTIIVGTATGGIVERSAGSWTSLLSNATSPALPG